MGLSFLKFIPIIKSYLLAYIFTYLLFLIYSLGKTVGSFVDSSFNNCSGASGLQKKDSLSPLP